MHYSPPLFPALLPLLRFTKLPHVCLLHWLGGMRFDERHPGLLHIKGGIAISLPHASAALSRETKCDESFHVGQGPSGPSGVIAGTKHSSPAAQRIVRIPSARSALGVGVHAAAAVGV